MNYNKVNFINKESCFIEKTVKIEENVTIYPNNTILGNTVIKSGSTLYSNNFIKDSIIGENSEITYSHITESLVEENCKIGPYCHLRPNSKIGKGCKLGNFVEVKNSSLGENTKASHLAYIGDATIGKNCNIGCGAIFVNYNGKTKNKIEVGDNCFIGSNVNLIAPLKLAPKTYICAGTTLTQNTNEYDFIIGRAKETIKPNRAKNYLKEE